MLSRDAASPFSLLFSKARFAAETQLASFCGCGAPLTAANRGDLRGLFLGRFRRRFLIDYESFMPKHQTSSASTAVTGPEYASSSMS